MMELIDCIYVKENGDIKIKFKFEDEFKRCLEYIEIIKYPAKIISEEVDRNDYINNFENYGKIWI